MEPSLLASQRDDGAALRATASIPFESPTAPATQRARQATLTRLLLPGTLSGDPASGFVASWREQHLLSQFQSILSIDRTRVLGAQGLVRLAQTGARDAASHLFEKDLTQTELLALDRLLRTLHAANFSAGFARGELLFLNVHPALPEVVKSEFGLAFARLLALLGVAPESCALELRLDLRARPGQVRDALRGWRSRGFGVLVDLGVGPSPAALDFLASLGLLPDFIKFTPTSELDVSRAALAPWAAAGVKLIGTRLGDAGSVALALAAGAQWLQGRAIDAKA